MKKIFFLLLINTAYQITMAQNVGIGTTAPNVDALLDISSTSKGVLFPRMTSLQRISINTPPNGLMVYDTDRNELYQYISATFSWKALINDSYWRRQSLTRSRIGNSSDSVGIGTLSPTEWLGVDGNIRTRNTLIADNNVVATGVVSAGTLNSSGNLFVTGTSSLSGNVTANSSITTNGDIIMNNSGATLQLKDGSNVNKGFFQLNTENIRLGTNVGNTLGSVVVRLNGSDRLVITPSGDMDMDGNITRVAATGIRPLLPACYGVVTSGGIIVSGTNNFSVVKGGLGEYRINCVAITGSSTIVASPQSVNRTVAAIAYSSYSSLNIFNPTGGAVDAGFNFIVY